jgi:hypothetical protein
MKKKAVISRVAEGLRQRGYNFVPGRGAGAASVHFKKWNDLLLLFGLQFSRHYDERFTGSFYLSLSFDWGFMLRGFPREAYQRVGGFLLPEERARLLTAEFQAEKVIDAWWIGFSELSVDRFLEAHDCTCPRFLSQPQLAENVRSCAALKEHVEMIHEVIELSVSLNQKPLECEIAPEISKMKIDIEWYWAAEVILRRFRGDPVLRDLVNLLALDSWRYKNL